MDRGTPRLTFRASPDDRDNLKTILAGLPGRQPTKPVTITDGIRHALAVAAEQARRIGARAFKATDTAR